MPEYLSRRQFSKTMYGRECRLDVWAHIANLGQQEPPITQFTAKEILAGVNHDFPPSTIRLELDTMVDLDMLVRVDGSKPLHYQVTTSDRLGELAWGIQDAIEAHYQATFGSEADNSASQ